MKNSTFSAQVANNLLKVLQGYTKGIRLIALLTMLCTVGVGQMWAEEATLSFADKAQRTSQSTTQQVWQQNGITFTNNKSASTTSVGDYAKPVRLYASSEVIVECSLGNITKIVFDCNSNDYATAMKNSIGNTATASSDKVTVNLDGTSKTFTVAKLTAQVRLDALTVTYTAGGDPEPPTQTTTYTIKWYTAVGTSDDVTVDEGAAITKPATDPTMSGYEFMGWTDQCSVAEDGAGFTPISNFGTADSDKEFYAVFAVATTTGGGGGSSTESIFLEDFSSITSGNSTSTSGSNSQWSKNSNFYSVENAYQAGGAVKLGSSKNSGALITKQLTAAVGETLTISFKVKGWSSVEGNIQVSGNNSEFTTPSAITYTSTMSGSFESKTVSVVLTTANPYIKIATTAKRAFIDDIEITKTSSGGGSTTTYDNYITTCSGATVVETLTDAQFAWSAATAEATMGATNTFPTLTNTVPVSVTYESSTPATATIADDGTITLVAPGTTTISAKFAGGEVGGTTYAAKTVTYTLTVLKAAATPTGTVYVKVTDAITDGEYLIVYEDAEGDPKAPVAFNGALTDLDEAKNTVEVTINSNTIAGNTDIDAATFTIDATAGSILSKSGYYIGNTTASNGLSSNKTTALKNEITLSEGTLSIKATDNATASYLKYNKASDQTRFRYYKSGQEAIALYKKASSHTLTYGTCTNGSVSADVADGATVLSGTTITLTATPATNYKLSAYDVYKTGDATTKVTVNGNTFVMPEFDVTISATFVPVKTLTSIEVTTPATQTTFWQGETFNSTGLVVTAHFDGAADEDVTDKVTVTGSTATAGTQTVTVSYTEGTTTKTATYTITVKAIPNTKETAYSVADAYDIIDKLTTAEGVFISGIISQVDSYNSTYKSITYWISADGTTTKQLEVYSGKGLESADFTAVTDLSVGDQVIVCGNLKLYNEIYEFDKNNYLAAYTPTTKDPAGLAYATTEYTVNLGDAFATPVLSNPNGLTVTYSTSDALKATVDANTGAVTIVAAGTVTITASTIGDATHDAGTASYTITIIDPYENIARLPFTYNSGKAAIETTAGITHSGLGSDYTTDGVPPLKFDTEGDNVIINFDSEPGEFSFILKQNGSNAGTFTVYESSNGEDYTPVWTGGDLGNAQSATITPTLAAASRYVKFEYTTKPSGTNYGLGSISIQKPDLRADAGLVWNPNSVTLTKGDAFTAPTLSNPYSVSGITYESSNTDVATVTDAGVIALAGSTGEATIIATFAGDATYKRATATCTIIVNAIPALDAPTGLTVTDLTCSSVTLSWNAVTNATGYEVDRILSGHKTTYETTELTITIKDLTGGLENAWKVRAIGDGIKHSNSEDANGNNFTTLFSVKYYVDEEIWHGCDNGCAANDGSYEICETVPTKANYDFAGWATSNGGEVAYQAGGTINDIAANVTLHAVWTLKKYTVTWIADETETTVQFDHGANLTLPDAPTPCDGMEFVGWTTQRAYIHNTDPLFTEATGTVTSDATYYAVFATQGTSTGETTLDFSTQGYENAAKVTYLEKNGITVTFDKGGATTDATYYDNGTAVRVYQNGTFTVASEESTISQIVLTLTGSETNPITSNIGSYESGTWTGSAKSITFTVGDDKDKYRRIKSITVRSEGSGSTFTGHTTTCSGTTTLDAPQNLAVSNIKYNSATFTWDEVEGARSYFITIGDMTPITTTTNTYTTNPLKAGTAYTWSVQALGNNTNVLHSSVTTGPEFRTGASVTITWVTGGESTTTTTTAGLPLGTLKNATPPDGCSGKAFMGWSTTRNIASDGSDFEKITEKTVPTKNATYYAVFAEQQNNGGASGNQLFYESFNTNEGKGGNDDQWNNITTSTEMVKDGWEFTKGYVASQCIRLGTSSIAGSATTPALGIDGTATLSFNAGAWNGDGEQLLINLVLVGEGTITPNYITLNKGKFDTYTATINGANADTKVRFIAQNASKNRFFLDEVYVHSGSNVTYTDYSTSCGDFLVTYYGFNTGGYTTICGDNPGEITVPQFDPYTIPTCTPTEDPQGLNRTFAGTWVDDKGNSYKPGDSFDVTDDITLYAQWKLETTGDVELSADQEDLATTDIVVTGGHTLTIPDNETITINSLTLKGGLLGTNSESGYDMPSVVIPDNATLVRKNTTINLDLVVNSDSWYPFAVPFAATINANVEYLDPTLAAASEYGTHFAIKTYDGARRAEEGVDQTNNWVQLNRNEKLQPGVGYIISALTYPNKDTATIRIPMTVDNAWLANGEQESITVKEQTTTRNAVEVVAHKGTAAKEHQRHAGWNFVANPYLTNFAGTNASNKEGAFINGEILINNGEYSYGGEDVPYVTIPTYNFAHYYQQQLSEATLSPAYGFFVQVGTSGTMDFTTTGRQQAPASIAARAEERPVKMDVDITLSDNHSSDQTGIIISDRYNDTYEIGRDLEKLFGSAYNLSVYTLMADNTPLAYQALAIRSNMQVIPVGYRAPEQGEYTFRLNEATSSIDLLNEQYEQLVLVDYQTGELTNLLIADYTFYSERVQSDSRFALYAVPRQNAPTDLPNAIGQDKQAQKIIHNGHLYILRDGNVYNGNGQIVK